MLWNDWFRFDASDGSISIIAHEPCRCDEQSGGVEADRKRSTHWNGDSRSFFTVCRGVLPVGLVTLPDIQGGIGCSCTIVGRRLGCIQPTV